MRDYNNFKYTCLFGGGAIRGAAHVGVLKAMEDVGIEPDILGGSSVGSIVAALYAVGFSSDELSDIFLSVNFELFRDLSFGFTQKFALSKGEVFLEWIRDLIEKKFYGDKYVKGENQPVRFKDISKNLVIITTNLKEFQCKEYSTFLTPDEEIALAVRISCCLPGLMRAVTVENELLVDGDLMKGKPMWYLSENLKNSGSRILEVRLEGVFTGSDQNPIEYVNGMYTCMTYSETDFIKNVYGHRDKYDYLVVNTGNVIVVDFNYPPEKRQEIIDSGYSQTINYFKDYLVQKKRHISEIYDEILYKLRNAQGYIILGKYKNAKSVIADMFIYISGIKDVIDYELYLSVSSFQKLLYNNVKHGLLGYCTCADKKLVQSELNIIIEDVTKRIDGLRRYISKFSV